MVVDSYSDVIEGRHRKHAIRLLNTDSSLVKKQRSGPKPKYGADVVAVLEQLWLVMNLPGSELFRANIPIWLPFFEQKHPVDVETRKKIQEISTSSVDRIMRPVHRKHGSHGLGWARQKEILFDQSGVVLLLY